MFFFVLNSDLMLVQINDIVASTMVLPNRQVFPLVKEIQVAPLRWSNPQVIKYENLFFNELFSFFLQGVVRVVILRARNLIKADITLLGKGKSDPFVRVKGTKTK